jgi:hypothetical protein
VKGRIDWQAYLDGTLGKEELAIAEQALKTDPCARRELDALKKFILLVGNSARSEMVPTRRFEFLIPRPAPNHVFRKFLFALVPVAVFAGAWYQTSRDTARLDQTPVTEIVHMRDPQQASTWATEQLGTGVPVVTLKGRARMCLARRGNGWAAFDYHVGRDRYSLIVSPDPTPLLGKPRIRIASNQFVTSRGVGWEQKGLAFYLTGPSPEMRISLACAASEEIATQTLAQPRLHCLPPNLNSSGH